MANNVKNRLRINMESGHFKETNISLPSYEMYQAELLDRMLLSIQHTEEAFIDVNNRIITNVNARKDRLNMINHRVQNISAKILALYNTKKLMRITSPAILPEISTSQVPSNHPHQTVFFDREEIMDLATEIDEGAQPAPVISNKPELSSLKLTDKLYNTRIRNNPEDLQQVISGATKHIYDITKLLLSMSKYRADTMGALNNTVNHLITTTNGGNPAQPANASQEGVLGSRPANVTSVSELMLFDTNTNVYEDRSMTYIQETGAVFNIRGRKQKVLSKKEKQQIEAQKKLQITKKAIRKAEEIKRNIAAAPESFNKNNQIKYKMNTNEFTYVGAQQDTDVNIGGRDSLDGSDDESDGDDNMEDFFNRNKKADQKKKINMTTALINAQQDAEMSMMNPNQSRMPAIAEETGETPDAQGETADNEDGETPEAGEGEDGDTTAQTDAPIPERPTFDKNAMEDMAPAERLRINQEINIRAAEEKQRMIEEMIAAEKEKDPDALDEDIISKVNQQVAQKKMGDSHMDTTVNVRKNKAPAIALGTVIAATPQAEVGTGDESWKNQVFISKQKTQRVGGPPRGPPPTGGRPGAPPRGPPPTGGRAQKSQTLAPQTAGKAAGTASSAPASNSNIPKAPPIGHFMAFIKGTYDPANPPADGGSAPGVADDLQFDPIEMIGGDQMPRDSVDGNDMAAMIDAIGDDGPEVERSSMKIKPVAEMTLVEQLQAQQNKLKPAGSSSAPASDAAPVEKPLSEMTLVEQLQAQQNKLKPAGASKRPESESAPVEKPLSEMTLVEQLQHQQAKMKPAGSSKAKAEASGNVPEKKLEDMSLDEQLAYGQSRLKPAKNRKAEEQPAVKQPESPKEEEKQPRAMSVISEEPGRAENSRFDDSFRSDASFVDQSLIEESKDVVEQEVDRMTVIQEDPEAESRKTGVTSAIDQEAVPEVKAPVIQQPLRPAVTMVQKTKPQPKPMPALRTAATIKTSDRRISNIDRLKLELAVRQATMNGGKKRITKDDSSDDNESSDDDSDDSNN